MYRKTFSFSAKPGDFIGVVFEKMKWGVLYWPMKNKYMATISKRKL
jgi:hypothetical protein